MTFHYSGELFHKNCFSSFCLICLFPWKKKNAKSRRGLITFEQRKSTVKYRRDDDDDVDSDHVRAVYKRWNDFQLEWKPETFGNITKTRLPVNKLWIPDVSVLNRSVSCYRQNRLRAANICRPILLVRSVPNDLYDIGRPIDDQRDDRLRILANFKYLCNVPSDPLRD